MANSDFLEIPQIQPFQFSSDIKSVDNSVNLFRGDVNFYIPLVSFTGRNGLDLQVSALYRSNVHENVKSRNAAAPTSILGLGWELPTDSIIVDSTGTGDEDNKYYFVRNSIRSRLFRNDQLWLRGIVNKSFSRDLDSLNFSAELYAALLSEGLRIDSSSKITIISSGSSWLISDSVTEFDLKLELSKENDIQVYDNGKSYELQGYDFSRIRYYATYEKWEITYTNGISNVFGGHVITTQQIKSSCNQTIQWGVCVGNWNGPSIVTHASSDPAIRIQTQYAKAWNFASSRTIWNDEVVFEYDQVTQQVGVNGLPYTKAIYLKKIKDVFGRTVVFSYNEKTYDTTSQKSPKEYGDPNKQIPNNDADAYQSNYETRYLNEIHVFCEKQELLFQLNFKYTLERYTNVTSDSLYGETYKRTLTTVSKTLGTGHSFPNIDLLYYDVTNISPGALKSITYAEGSTLTYAYSKTELINCERNLTISNPVPGSIPRVWFGVDYSVVTWYSQGSLYFEIYTWIGRWQKWVPVQTVINDYIDINEINCELQKDYFVLFYKNANGQSYTYRAFHKDSRMLGSWIEYDDSKPIVLFTNECSITGGENYFAIADLVTATVNTYTWNALNNTWQQAPLINYTPPTTPSNTRLFMSGVNNVLMFLSYDKLGAPGQKNNILNLYFLDELGQWNLGDTSQAPQIIIDQSNLSAHFTWSAQPWAITATYVTDSSQSTLQYNISIYQWEASLPQIYKFKKPVTKSFSIQKSNPSANITIPYTADCTPQGLLSSGPNLMRYNGEQWLENTNLAIQLPVVDGTIFWFTVGPDFVIKTENSESQVLGMIQVFDPNTQSFQWQEQAVTLFDSQPTGDRYTQYFPSGSTDYLTWNTDVYERGTSTNWVDPLQSPSYSITPGTDTTTLINQGPNFMVYLLKEAGTNAIKGTQVITMTNGIVDSLMQINERFFSLVDSQGNFVGNAEGKMPGGLNSFLTYLPLDANFDQASSVTLYRYIGQTLENPIVNYPATQVSISDGFNTIETLYDFDIKSAACDYQGSTAKYYKTTVSKGKNKVNGYSVYSFYNSINESGFINGNLKTPSFLDGTLYLNTVYDSNNNIVSSSSSEFEVITSIADKSGTPANRPIYGAIVQVKQSKQVQDGIESITKYQYDPSSGNVLKQELSSYNASGQLEIHSKKSVYGYAVYSQLAYSNNLSQIVQSKEIVNVNSEREIVNSCSVTTIKQFPVVTASSNTLQLPALFETYIWLGGNGSSDFDFANWSSGVGCPDSWLKTTSVQLRSNCGVVFEKQAPMGKIQSDLYSLDQSVIVASFTNASIQNQEAYYYGFEAYEDKGTWLLDSNTPIVDTISYTGTHCLNIPPNKKGISLLLTPKNQQRDYIFSCWAKSDPGYTLAKEAGWKVQLYNGTSLVEEMTLVIQPSDTWQFYFQSINLSKLSAKSCTVIMTPFNLGGVNVFCDNITFNPFENPMNATVYDSVNYYAVAQLGPYNSTKRSVYDSLGRVIGQTGDFEELTRVVGPFLSRQINGVFSTSEPNSNVNFQPMGITLIDRFYNNGIFKNNWTTASPAKWASDKGYLIHTGSNNDQIQLSNEAFNENFVVHIGFMADATVGNAIGIKVGSDMTIQWTPSLKKWQLLDPKNGIALNCGFESSEPEEDWILVLSHAAVFFFVEGRLAFSYVPKVMISGAFTLFTADNVRYTNFLIGLQPQVAVQFFDGTGKNLQGQSLEGNKVTVTQTVYDSALLPAVTTMPATLDVGAIPLLAYRSDAVTNFDWNTGVMRGAIADYLPEAEGYPYSRKIFENSPLARTLAIGAPGKDFAITGSENPHIVRYSYGCNTNEEGTLPPNQYLKTKRFDQNGNSGYALRDKFGNQINNVTGLANGSNIKSASLLNYSNIGKTKTEQLPNYFNPPAGSKAEDWQRMSFTNKRGQLISFTEPNSGTTYFIYNQDGLVRFSQNAEQADKGFVLYKIYDTENRIIEEGYFAAKWDQNDLQSQADADPTFPGKTETVIPQNRYYYNGDKRTLNDLGNLTLIEVMSKNIKGQVELSIRQQYNNFQKLTQTDVTLINDKITFTTINDFDNLGNAKSITYPSGIQLHNIRDEVGRVIKIVDANKNEMIDLTYTAGDQILSETNKANPGAPITTTYSYNAQGWLTKAQSPQLTEIITYINNGYGSVGYYDGTIASKTIQMSLPLGSQLPSQLSYKYKYDETYRVKVAECTLGGQVMTQWSLGLANPITYDSNGNFIKVDTENYVYLPGKDFVVNTDGTAKMDFSMDKNGATVTAVPRGITSILRDIYSGKPNSIETQTKGTINFVYDNKNNRVSKKVSNTNKFYGRNSSGAVLTEKNTNAGATSTTDYLYGPSGMFAVKTDATMNAIQKDHLKSPRLLTDDAGNVVSAFQYEPFGSVIDDKGSNLELLNYLFGGYEQDSETGLYNAGARLYDPVLKRFYCTDPKMQYASPYLFSGNNPMNLVDPNGESSWWAILIGAVVGTIVTIATGGAGAVLLGTELAASMAVGAVAGTAGSLIGDATTAGISGEKFTAQRALIDALSGFAGGAVGAGVGGAAGRGAMNAAFNAGKNTAADIGFVTRLGTATSSLTGGLAGATASAAVTSAMTGQPFFSKETAMNMAIGAVAGAGGALMAAGAHFGWFGAMPVELGANDFNRINGRLDLGAANQKLLTFVSDADYNSTRARILNTYGTDDAIFRMSPAGPEVADVIALHGIGRFVFPMTTGGYSQPMSANLFAQYLTTNHPYLDANVNPALGVVPLKLSVCFSALPGNFGSVGQTLASALGRVTSAGRGVVYPANLAQNWITFNP